MKYLFLVALIMAGFAVSGQTRARKFPANINHTSVNNYAPFISFDGSSIVYISDLGEDYTLTMTWSQRDGGSWQDPVAMPRSVNNKLNFIRGFALSADGKTLYITNMRSNGLGGFDLYQSQLKGTIWSEPVNVSLPINSKEHDGCPSLSADGSMMFFTRCAKMDFQKASGCRILMSRKKANGQWDTPVELPSSINTGNSQAPRIMGDNETLFFSSDQMGGKGGMDLFMTRLEQGSWSAPKPMDFVNTAGDDMYVSAISTGRYLVCDQAGQRNRELVEVFMPADIRPKGSMKIMGTIGGSENTTAYVSLYDFALRKEISSARPSADGSFVMYAKEGSRYDLSVDPEKDNFLFFSRVFDLTVENFPLQERMDGTIRPAAAGDELTLEVPFTPGTSELSPDAVPELRRLTRLMQGNPDMSFSIQVKLDGFRQDSLQSDPDLTELRIDSTRIPVTYKIDSVTTGTRDSVVVKRTYHNDRTKSQAQRIAEHLVQQGIPARRIALSGQAVPAEGDRKTTVRVILH